MSMALALEYTVDWLRDKNGWTVQQCGVQYDAIPAMDAGPFYVAVDDAGVESGDASTDSLKEILTITIGIWRRPEHLMKDKRGILKLSTDKYLIGAYTLAELERAVLIHNSAIPGKNGLHHNWAFVNGINARYNLPQDQLGAGFITPLSYRGRGRMESIAIDNGSTDPAAFFGYRLRFRGLMREMKLRAATHAVG